MNQITRSNGRTFSIKEDKDRFFFPKEYMDFEKQLKKRSKHTVWVQINTGARINELQHVKVEDCYVNEKRILLKVTKTKARKGEKKGRHRMIPVSTTFAKYLKKYITKNKLKQDDTLNLLSTPALNTAIKIAANNAEIKDYNNFSSHNLRKTLEVWLMSLGVDTLSLLAHFGHDMKTAAQSYVSPDILSYEDKSLMRQIIDDLYDRRK